MARVLGLLSLMGGMALAIGSARGDGGSLESSRAEELRRQGPAGLQTALVEFDQAAEAVAKFDRESMLLCRINPNAADEQKNLEKSLEAARTVVDEAAGQRDATVSRLFWYTDIEQAEAAAAESGKPILSLRMLGKLTDEYSCANSRYFRTALYSNKEISDFLRDHFILHWQSVRPVPRVTIDFGDGRKLERTITGNSAHYVLSATCHVLDALPGLYGPQAFEGWLKRTSALTGQLASEQNEARRADMLVSYHAKRSEAIEAAIQKDMGAVNPALAAQTLGNLEQSAGSPAVKPPTAFQAAVRAESKFGVERPLVAAVAPAFATLVAQTDDFWRQVALLHVDQAKLDPASVELMRRENPTDPHLAQIRTVSKARIEDPILRVVQNFEQAMAIDTVKNEYTLHRKIHQWFVAGEAPASVDALNERVYAELFLTPSSDPWLGLAPADAYSGLTCGGLTSAGR